MKYYYDGDITPKVIANFISIHKTGASPKYKRLEEYYLGEHEILSRVLPEGKPNNHIVVNYPNLITDTVAAYFQGVPNTYTSRKKDEVFLERMTDMFQYTDEHDNNTALAKNISIFGVSYELMYIDRDKLIRFKDVSPINAFTIHTNDMEETMVAFIRYSDYQAEPYGPTKTRVEFYDNSKCYIGDLDNNNLTFTSEQEHFFLDVPVAVYINNKYELSDYSQILSLVDAYNRMQSDTMNDFDSFSDAILKLKGSDLFLPEDATKEEEAEYKKRLSSLRQERLLLLDGEGDAEWLIKQIPDAAAENFKNRLVNEIHMISQVPNLSDESFAGNLSGVAIKQKMYNLDNLSNEKERGFKRGIQRRIELICNFLKVKEGKAYDYRDIAIEFHRNLPMDELAIVERLTKLRTDLEVPLKYIYSKIPNVDDVELLLQMREEELGSEVSREYPDYPQFSDEKVDESRDLDE